jgi:hypothetical protein
MRRQEKAYSRDGRRMTYRERRHLNRLQDRADRQITRSKQNRHRNPYLRPFRHHTDPYRSYTDPYRRYWR